MQPILITAYNRLSTLKKTIESLKKCDGFEGRDIIAFVDGDKDKEDRLKINAVVDYLMDEDIEVIEWYVNMGIKESTLESIQYMTERFDSFIFIQDDMEFSKDFILFMDWALDEFKDNEKIMIVSGYTQIDFPFCYTSYIPSEAIGIWSHKWKLNPLDISDEDFMKRFEAETIFIPDIVRNSARGKNDSFSAVLAYSMFKQNKVCLHPDRNKLRHLFTDSVNCRTKDAKNFNQELYEGWEKTVDMFRGHEELKKVYRRKWYKKLSRKMRNKLEDYCDPIMFPFLKAERRKLRKEVLLNWLGQIKVYGDVARYYLNLVQFLLIAIGFVKVMDYSIPLILTIFSISVVVLIAVVFFHVRYIMPYEFNYLSRRDPIKMQTLENTKK